MTIPEVTKLNQPSFNYTRSLLTTNTLNQDPIVITATQLSRIKKGKHDKSKSDVIIQYQEQMNNN